MPALDGWENLDKYLAHLQVRAWELALNPRLKARFGESDLVNETMLRAQASSSPCRDESPRVRLAYLDSIFDAVFIDFLREHHAQIRTIDKEVQQALSESAAGYRFDRADSGTSPSEKASRNENYLLMASAITRLPAKERDLIILVKLQESTVPEAAERLGIHPGHAYRVLKSAVKRLSQILKSQSGESS